MNEPARLAVARLAKTYGRTRALEDVSIGFLAGEVHAVLGENGSGKSTLVKILSGVVRQDEGALQWDGEPFAANGPAGFAARGFATVFQEVLIAPDRSVIDNVLLGRDSLLHWRDRPRDRRAVAAAAIARIARTPVPLDARAGDLPLALQQIVVIARALARDPQVLILDEATAALDHPDRDAVFAAVEALAKSGCVVIFISHRMDEVARLAQRVTVLRNGRRVGTLPANEASSARVLAMMGPERAAAHV